MQMPRLKNCWACDISSGSRAHTGLFSKGGGGGTTSAEGASLLGGGGVWGYAPPEFIENLSF